jgi:rare lipoprotein A
VVVACGRRNQENQIVRKLAICGLAAFVLLGAPACAGTLTRASWYGGGEYLARRTASGERFNPAALTAAHRSLPFGTRLRVCRARRCIVVRINDRGPAARTGRGLDLSSSAASAIGLKASGVGVVSIERLSR